MTRASSARPASPRANPHQSIEGGQGSGDPLVPMPRSMGRGAFVLTLLAVLALTFIGCKQSKVDEALDTDANGYQCAKCAAKFYTDRDVFPNTCPQCKQSNIKQVMGFVCSTDKHVTLGVRGRQAVACEKCKRPTSGMAIPRESDLKAWGAVKKTAAEVGA